MAEDHDDPLDGARWIWHSWLGWFSYVWLALRLRRRPSYQDVIMADKPVGFWRLDDTGERDD